MFKDNDIICFLGDSITANGLYYAEAYQYLRKKYKIKCYNCGVSGNTAKNALEYLYSNCLIFNPDYVVIMFGINDLRRNLYSDSCTDANREEEKQLAIDTHIESYEKLICQITASGAKVIVCVPPPYDEVNDTPTENLHCQCGMDKIESLLRKLAEKYNCPIVDYKKVMLPMLTKRNILNADRVHPTDEGHHVMAQIFLKDLGEKDEYDFDTPFEFEDWNLARYTAERRLHKTKFVELCALLHESRVENMTNEEKKQIAKARYDECEDKDSFIATAYDEYIKTIDIMPQLIGEIVKLTIF